MPSISEETVIRGVKKGAAPDEALIAWLTQTTPENFVNAVRPMYPFVFQERRIGQKWEIGLARACHTRLLFRLSRRSLFPIAYLPPVFRDCLFVVSDRGQLTGLSVARYHACRPAKNGYAMSSGGGYHLFRDFKEWMVKPVKKRTTVLPEEVLRKYRWRFDPTWLRPTSSTETAAQ